MSVYNSSTGFKFTRSNNSHIKPNLSQDHSNNLTKWQDNHMYRTSNFSQSMYNVKTIII